MNREQFVYAATACARYLTTDKSWTMQEKGRVSYFLATELDNLYDMLYGNSVQYGPTYVPTDAQKVELTSLLYKLVPLWAGRETYRDVLSFGTKYCGACGNNLVIEPFSADSGRKHVKGACTNRKCKDYGVTLQIPVERVECRIITGSAG